MQSFHLVTIIPTYRRPETLRNAIASVLLQTGVSAKIIVADDCPNGSAAAVAAEFADVLYLSNPTPTGGWPGRVRNFAFAQVEKHGISARFVHFLDDDDVVPAGFYADAVKALDAHPNRGVVFGVLRPFCVISPDPERRQRQIDLLERIQTWRMWTARFPWLFQGVGDAIRLPSLTNILMRQHALFGPEMFLCSGGIIRYAHVKAMGGFPDIRITQDYWFYTDAIRRYGCIFLKREAAGYGVGDTGAIWNPLDLSGAAKEAHTQEWSQELADRTRQNRVALGAVRYTALKLLFKGQNALLRWFVMPTLDRFGYFNEMYRITKPDYVIAADPTAPTTPLTELPLAEPSLATE